MNTRVLLVLLLMSACQLILFDCKSYAGNFGAGVHSGYGILKFKERETSSGDNFELKSEQKVILFGGSGEYSFPKPDNLYIGVITDWAFGLKDVETLEQNKVEVQTNDMRFFGQFYDLRFGYKDNLRNFYYRVYISGGWDGLRFKRDNYVWQGSRIQKSTTEDISLWRTGAGTGFGYRIGEWSLDSRVAYSFYPDGKTEDSSYPQVTFDTYGTCLDAGFGAAYSVTERASFYAGMSYTLQNLKGSTTDSDIFWKSKLEIIVGMVNLTYAF